MKKHFLLVSIALAIILSVASCNKNDSTDLTVNLIGTYSGAFVDSSAGVNYDSLNEAITITKIDNSHIQVSQVNNSIIPFTASLTATSNGVTLNIPQQSINGVNIVGNPNYNSDPTVNGAYLTSSRTFASSVFVSYNGTTLVQTYVGSH